MSEIRLSEKKEAHFSFVLVSVIKVNVEQCSFLSVQEHMQESNFSCFPAARYLPDHI